ncbi:DUF6939 family protein [Streptomyces violaceusniger]|uniref:DUF6939 family protein n=1 Tax=Streptomyces violaceusniger TaxID=68280 RepID=UPI0038120598
MSIRVASRRRAMASLTAAFPGAEVIDVTSKAPEPWVRPSPFSPHGGRREQRGVVAVSPAGTRPSGIPYPSAMPDCEPPRVR